MVYYGYLKRPRCVKLILVYHSTSKIANFIKHLKTNSDNITLKYTLYVCENKYKLINLHDVSPRKIND